MSRDSFHRMLDNVINSSDRATQAGWFARLGRALGLDTELEDYGRMALEGAGFGRWIIGPDDDLIFVALD